MNGLTAWSELAPRHGPDPGLAVYVQQKRPRMLAKSLDFLDVGFLVIQDGLDHHVLRMRPCGGMRAVSKGEWETTTL